MNDKEKQLLELIENNPFISQNELSELSGLSRSAVAGYISSFMKKGLILGRAYVLPKKTGVVCIGGANVDRKLQVENELQQGTSNPATSFQSTGGVARNISENLGRIGMNVSLLSVVGDDAEGKWLIDETKPYVNMDHVSILPKHTTGTYSAILTNSGDMFVAIADMGIYDDVDSTYFEKKWGTISSAEMVLLDTNFSPEVIRYILRRCKYEKIPVTIAPVSAPKVKKLPENLTGTTWLITNHEEAESLLNTKLIEDSDFFLAAKKLINRGVERVVISRGEKGIIYYTRDGNASVILPPTIEVKDVTGAGDSLVAGIIYGHVHELEAEKAAQLGMACSYVTLQSTDTVSRKMSKDNIQKVYKQYY
ncbi:carbohydrate kinase [Bacillus sp. 2205SS5-2]|uniref:carbohydrate kinase n=1 Tax=Bacillus sp. 2205SS5-2 TaxID=3109031 RepID=UPI0030074C33